MTSVTRPTVAVLGAGSWGTALAALLARNDVPTRLWGRDADALAAMAASRRNLRYLPDLDLPTELTYEADLARVLRGADIGCWVLTGSRRRTLTARRTGRRG